MMGTHVAGIIKKVAIGHPRLPIVQRLTAVAIGVLGRAGQGQAGSTVIIAEDLVETEDCRSAGAVCLGDHDCCGDLVCHTVLRRCV